MDPVYRKAGSALGQIQVASPLKLNGRAPASEAGGCQFDSGQGYVNAVNSRLCVVCHVRKKRKGRDACDPCWYLTGVENTRERYGLPKENPSVAATRERVKDYNRMVRAGKSREHICAQMGLQLKSLSPWITRMRKAGFRVEPYPVSEALKPRELLEQLRKGKLPPKQQQLAQKLLKTAPTDTEVPVQFRGSPPKTATAKQVREDHPCPEHGRVSKTDTDVLCGHCRGVNKWLRVVYVRNFRERRRGQGNASVAETV